MKVFIAVVLAAAVAAVQAIDYDNLIELPIKRGYAAGPSSRITGGTEVEPNSLPYQVGLFIKVEKGTSFCGGSLISPEWVLTAAHCADEGISFEVVLGAHEIRNEAEPTQVRVVTTDKIVHPDWDRENLTNDVALLRLTKPVKLTGAIQTIRLPSLTQINKNESFTGVLATESGWGRKSDASTSIAERLQSVDKPIIAHEACNFKYFGNTIKNAHICTDGSRGQSTCRGDSGGPLVVPEEDGKLTEIGVVSFGLSLGCQIGWPPVFARLTTYTSWISEQTGIPLRA